MSAWRVVAAATALLFLNACTSMPDKVDAAYIPSARYASATCTEIAEEMIAVGTRAAQLSAQLEKAAGTDAALVAVSIILFWPAAFFVGGDKQKEAELARLKGERDALVRAAKQKGCRLEDAAPVVQQAVTQEASK